MGKRVVSEESAFVGPITSLLLISVPMRPRNPAPGKLLLVGSGCFLSAYSLAVVSGNEIGKHPQPVLYHKVLAHDRIHHIKLLPHQDSSVALNPHLSFVCVAGGREFAICSIELSVPVADTNHGQSLYSSRSDIIHTGSLTPRPPFIATIIAWALINWFCFHLLSWEIFWGQRSWTLHKLKALTINDWIVDINYYEQSSQGHARIALLTAHNRLMLYEVDVCGKPIETRSVACQDTTLLLSGQIRIRQQDQRLIFSVAAGSISGNVTLWEWIHDEQTHHSVILQAVQTTLVGHRGAIYDLAFSPRGQKLCTASEDRTVRVWDLNKPAESPLVLWGHLGRVWRVHWWNCEQLTSVGEDCQALTWKLPASWSLGNPEYENHKPNIECSPKPFSIRQPPHDGRSIWSVTHDQETGYLLTGGADGKICTTLIEPTYPPEIQGAAALPHET
ncbi:hypothetical protein VP01_238g12 [Puccinia sorghi]|uniref:Uncharacterized protein n=1 Tax=Puccinia sorghi TaxID=27349 RepID=A0A0L6V8R3_9BASI|nr:hypothetical protein VP01_238g12 [Puccinia sorghi]